MAGSPSGVGTKGLKQLKEEAMTGKQGGEMPRNSGTFQGLTEPQAEVVWAMAAASIHFSRQVAWGLLRYVPRVSDALKCSLINLKHKSSSCVMYYIWAGVLWYKSTCGKSHFKEGAEATAKGSASG